MSMLEDRGISVEEACFRDRVREIDVEVQRVLDRTLPPRSGSTHDSVTAMGLRQCGLPYTTWQNASATNQSLLCHNNVAAVMTLTNGPSRATAVNHTADPVAPPPTLITQEGEEDGTTGNRSGVLPVRTGHLNHKLSEAGLGTLPELQRMCVEETSHWLDANLPAKLRDHIELGVKRIVNERWMSQLQVIQSTQTALQATLDDLSQRWRDQFGRVADGIDLLGRRVRSELDELTGKKEVQVSALREEVLLLKSAVSAIETDGRVGEQRTERRIDELTRQHHDRTRSALAELQSHLFTWQSETDAASSGRFASVRQACEKLARDVVRLEDGLDRCVDTAEAAVRGVNELLGDAAEQRSEVRVCRRDVNRLEMLVQCSADCADMLSSGTVRGVGTGTCHGVNGASSSDVLVTQELLYSRECISFLSGQLASLEKRVSLMERNGVGGKHGTVVVSAMRGEHGKNDDDGSSAGDEEGEVGEDNVHARHGSRAQRHRKYDIRRHVHIPSMPAMRTTMHRRSEGGSGNRSSNNHPHRYSKRVHSRIDNGGHEHLSPIRLGNRDHGSTSSWRQPNLCRSGLASSSRHEEVHSNSTLRRQSPRSQLSTPPATTRVGPSAITSESVDSVNTPPRAEARSGQYVPAATSDTESERENQKLSRLPLD